MDKSKIISRMGKEFNEIQGKDLEAISLQSANLNSYRLKKEVKINFEDYSYVVPWQMSH